MTHGMGFPQECVASEGTIPLPLPPHLLCPTKNTSWRKNKAEGMMRDVGEGFPTLVGWTHCTCGQGLPHHLHVLCALKSKG